MNTARDEFHKLSRRQFLYYGGLSAVGTSLGDWSTICPRVSPDHRRAVLVILNGGASSHETFDPKPLAPAYIRGPFKAISTTIPGICISETLPQLALRMHRCCILRGICHNQLPIHETGLQLLQTGGLAGSISWPHVGYWLTYHTNHRVSEVCLVHEFLPHSMETAGVHMHCGQSPGFLNGVDRSPSAIGHGALTIHPTREAMSLDFDQLFQTAFDRLCEGTRMLTINTCPRLCGNKSWDCHGIPGLAPSTLYDYRDHLCPALDHALSTFLDKLQSIGLFDETLVVVLGEIGRSPYLNGQAGREHWTQAWAGLIAGGGIRTGQVIGETDMWGAESVSTPLDLRRIYHTLIAWFNVPHPWTYLAEDHRLHTFSTDRHGTSRSLLVPNACTQEPSDYPPPLYELWS